ncbi:carbon-monoxide dehydrogenase medium subunit [Rhodovulum imhoffii]|uniref:Carbon-monoxide dehydrogenase medium subunit n=1 Tax=Rhodovulum imhoffii TaxID=365340 RepID=A0A2T5BTL8_9RHOB|nr:FAD binding domain-containing protein [Rhodovulum imhoffii]MBK5934340.1 carbon monoxide dehydrogenase [Rhodovulum imhoffii]PTN02709.1 carbon-monoxide dehydrogenase medium subunit [Rhodovulum imhoffii]
MYSFDLDRPVTLEAALAALKAEDAQPLGGGQTLIPALKQRLAAPSRLVSLAAIPDLCGIDLEGETLTIGAATPHAMVAGQAGAYPALAALAGGIGDPAVRNRGTIGGSLANNDPSACYPAAVLGSGAVICTNIREIAADDFFEGMFATALEDGEIIIRVRFPVPQAACYRKFDHPASRFALAGAFVARFPGSVRVAITGVSEEGVFRWSEAEAALSARFAPDALEGVSLPPEGMIEDLHGSSAYRAHLAGVMTRRAVAAMV